MICFYDVIWRPPIDRFLITTLVQKISSVSVEIPNVDIFSTLTHDFFSTRVTIKNLSISFDSLTLILPQTKFEAIPPKFEAMGGGGGVSILADADALHQILCSYGNNLFLQLPYKPHSSDLENFGSR